MNGLCEELHRSVDNLTASHHVIAASSEFFSLQIYESYVIREI
ncbi:MAG: hypothetical protein SVJ22_11760 [Halobacteriota archaeon]|nr:hypothetical protein [Halobacteriota archaeon]